MSEDKKYSATQAARMVLEKAQSMLKEAKLKKAQPEDRSKMSGKSGMVRATTEASQNQKGVNQVGDNGSSGGMSEAGNNVRNAAHGLKNGKANAVAIHKETLGQLKAMPKPNLTKDEDEGKTVPGQDDHTEKVDLNPEESEWGQEPGIFKLVHFCGKMDEKRKHKQAPESKEQESEKTPEPKMAN